MARSGVRYVLPHCSIVVVIVVCSSFLPHLYAVLFLACARDARVTKNTTNFHLWEKITTAQSCSVGN